MVMLDHKDEKKISSMKSSVVVLEKGSVFSHHEEPEGVIDNTGSIEIIHNRWFDIINGVPTQCLANCKYVPICYGGCKWMAKEGKPKCNKEFYERHLKDYLKLYVNANYANKIEKESLC